MQDINEERILLMLKKSPGEGISMAIDKYGGSVKTICKNILFDCSREDIEEAVADSFVGLWKSIDKFKRTGNYSLKSYFYGIARHTALDKRRVMKKETFVLPVEEVVIEATVDLECDYVKKLNENIVHDSVNSMEEPIRSVFILRYFYYEKDASMWGISTRGTKCVLNMQMKKLIDVDQIKSITLNDTKIVL